jgi:hypothetical protein
LEATPDLSFVRDWARDLYADRGRPSIDPNAFSTPGPVMFFEGIRSERQLIETASLYVAYRSYLGYALDEDLPDHSWDPHRKHTSAVNCGSVHAERESKHRLVVTPSGRLDPVPTRPKNVSAAPDNRSSLPPISSGSTEQVDQEPVVLRFTADDAARKVAAKTESSLRVQRCHAAALGDVVSTTREYSPCMEPESYAVKRKTGEGGADYGPAR